MTVEKGAATRLLVNLEENGKWSISPPITPASTDWPIAELMPTERGR
jgi:hypothetical protein